MTAPVDVLAPFTRHDGESSVTDLALLEAAVAELVERLEDSINTLACIAATKSAGDSVCGMAYRREQELRAALAKFGGYNEQRIAWELERTALKDGFYGNALRVAKDLPGVTAEDRSLLDRYATGINGDTDHVKLHDLANRIYHSAKFGGAK